MDGGRHACTGDHAEQPSEQPDPERLAEQLAHDPGLGPSDGSQRADLPHPLGDRRQRQQRGDGERGHQHDGCQCPTQPVGQAVGVRQAAGHLIGQGLGGDHLGAGNGLLDRRGDGVDRARLARLHENLGDPALLAGELLEGGHREVHVGRAPGERRPDEAGHREGGPVDRYLRSDAERLLVRVGDVEEHLVGPVLGDPAPPGELVRGDQADLGVGQVDPGRRVALVVDVGRRRVDHLADRLDRRGERRPELPEALRETVVEGRVPPAVTEAATTPTAGSLTATADLDTLRLQALAEGLALGVGHGVRPGYLGEGLDAGLDRAHDLRHRPGLVLGELVQAADRAGDARDAGDLRHRVLREAQQRGGEEEVTRELVARLAELGQVGDHVAVLVEERRRVRLVQQVGATTAAEEPWNRLRARNASAQSPRSLLFTAGTQAVPSGDAAARATVVPGGVG